MPEEPDELGWADCGRAAAGRRRQGVGTAPAAAAAPARPLHTCTSTRTKLAGASPRGGSRLTSCPPAPQQPARTRAHTSAHTRVHRHLRDGAGADVVEPHLGCGRHPVRGGALRQPVEHLRQPLRRCQHYGGVCAAAPHPRPKPLQQRRRPVGSRGGAGVAALPLQRHPPRALLVLHRPRGGALGRGPCKAGEGHHCTHQQLPGGGIPFRSCRQRVSQRRCRLCGGLRGVGARAPAQGGQPL